jgi:hypothetical protein
MTTEQLAEEILKAVEKMFASGEGGSSQAPGSEAGPSAP